MSFSDCVERVGAFCRRHNIRMNLRILMILLLSLLQHVGGILAMPQRPHECDDCDEMIFDSCAACWGVLPAAQHPGEPARTGGQAERGRAADIVLRHPNKLEHPEGFVVAVGGTLR